ncbi:2-oxoacid:acceptor oxidoreductase subunit alpha [Desulfurococcus mucosus]|uniref:2-oxoacid oxidoreductase (ferredoxin) n=1 Tax=Desulfurococcus mucosus (strain ATCC 35584 / DSM 2162 / JCM 9187 / O7/1) TaxID=765177 RepID=E8R811_DESM0|nr:2-oxoacid:acceptor oxidoreductase subunit alpha [Desulfurococcus mucosus]ADV64637.1 2-oxoglutarate ferredoxin oxidoreductase, alpha subunit [Desulfurococcus mucosus DSM 2162]
MRKTFASGNMAVAEAAITAGLKFYAGYPITPSSEIMEYLAEHLPRHGGIVIQMEDEIASINAVVGASWANVKAMTATSGPGFSLMAEGLGLAVMTETPLVVVDVMRAGPSTGVPTKTTQADIFQARWLAHGDYIIPSYAPWSVQEAYDLTIKAFNTAEKLRTPVILLSDAVIAHLWEPLVIRERGEVEIIERRKPAGREGYKPYMPGDDLVPPMACFGEGFKVLVESLTHDERGFYAPSTTYHRSTVVRLALKILKNIDYVFEYEAYMMDDAEVALVSYGSTARTVYALMRELRRKGVKAGLLRLKTLWPLDEEKIYRSVKAGRIIVVENNMGKLYLDVKRIFRDREVYPAPVISLELPTVSEAMEVVEQWL